MHISRVKGMTPCSRLEGDVLYLDTSPLTGAFPIRRNSALALLSTKAVSREVPLHADPCRLP